MGSYHIRARYFLGVNNYSRTNATDVVLNPFALSPFWHWYANESPAAKESVLVLNDTPAALDELVATTVVDAPFTSRYAFVDPTCAPKCDGLVYDSTSVSVQAFLNVITFPDTLT